MITHDRLRDLLDYCPISGKFTWRHSRGRVRAGDIAGRVDIQKMHGKRPRPNPYKRVIIQLDGKEYRAHRLAWFYVHGVWPSELIDHRDRDATNNSLKNLRDVSFLVNNNNRINSNPEKRL